MDLFQAEYPLGSRIELKELPDAPGLVEPGTMGTLYRLDDEGTLHIKLDDGRDLEVDVIYDSFKVLPPDDRAPLPNEEPTSGAPIEAQPLGGGAAPGLSGPEARPRRSGFDGERSHSERSETCPQGGMSDMELVATMGGMGLA